LDSRLRFDELQEVRPAILTEVDIALTMALMGTLRPPGPPTRTPDYSGDAAFFRALGDAHRLTIIATLFRARSPISVRTLSRNLPINQSSVSHHLTVLRDVGIVVGERRGTWGFYQIAPEMRAFLGRVLKAALRDRWCPNGDC
jgi:ArsR family transcriptional regulator, arsenate/arsenite/antimonite-responsive transcriptional repressor